MKGEEEGKGARAVAGAGTDLAPSTTGFGHGKVILLGEHTVVFGHPALAAGLRSGVRAHVRPGDGRIEAKTWGLQGRAGDGSPVGTAVAAIFEKLGVSGLDVELEADIPCGAGLGSSAAMAVAIARAVAARTGADAAAVAAAAHSSECVFHGTPSGVDTSAALGGGLGRFQKDVGWRALAVAKPIKLCVGLSGRARQTGAMVEAVSRLCRRTPVARLLLDTLAAATEAGIEALTVGDIDTLGRIFDVAHGALAGLRLSTPELDTLVHGARAAGAIGAKLTGAGGGGAVVALAPSHTNDVIARWRADGFDGFITVVGAKEQEGGS